MGITITPGTGTGQLRRGIEDAIIGVGQIPWSLGWFRVTNCGAVGAVNFH